MSTIFVKEILPELYQNETVVKQNQDFQAANVLCEIPDKQQTLPIYALKLGTTRKDAPCIA